MVKSELTIVKMDNSYGEGFVIGKSGKVYAWELILMDS